MKITLFILSALFLAASFTSCQETDSRAGTKEDREALFNYIIEKTIERESISEPKTRVMNFCPLREMLSFREEMIAADTDEALMEVLLKMSNVRRDRHTSVDLADDGLDVRRGVNRSIPVAFQTDFGTPENYFLFVGDYAENLTEYTSENVEIGDKLISFNNTPIDEYLEELRLHMRYSSYNGLWRQMAQHISRQHWRYPVPLDREEMTLGLEKSDGEQYELTLPYIDQDDIDWKGYFLAHGDDRYEGFEKTISTECYDLYEHQSRQVLVIDWYGFRASLIEDVDKLMEYAQENRLLNHDIIFDGTRSRGGSNGNYLIQRLFNEPYKATFGDLKLSDLTPKFVENRKKAYEEGRLGGVDDDGTRQIEWLTTDVIEAWERGDNFSNRVQHKLSAVDKDHDGVLQPAEVTFTGEVVSLLGPYGGSHLDQYASMVIDNQLGYTIGMPVGGFSSTWEFGEVLHFPISGKPVAYFEWGMGHTLRPNVDHPIRIADKYGRLHGMGIDPDGAVLEGNPPTVDKFIPQTRENYLEYYEILMDEAMRHLGHR